MHLSSGQFDELSFTEVELPPNVPGLIYSAAKWQEKYSCAKITNIDCSGAVTQVVWPQAEHYQQISEVSHL